MAFRGHGRNVGTSPIVCTGYRNMAGQQPTGAAPACLQCCVQCCVPNLCSMPLAVVPVTFICLISLHLHDCTEPKAPVLHAVGNWPRFPMMW